MKNIAQHSKKNRNQNNLISKIKQFFFTNGWEPLPYQIESWEAFLNGKNGIIQVPTGCGKTYAALMGPLSQIEDPKNNKSVNILLNAFKGVINNIFTLFLFFGSSICDRGPINAA